MSLTEIEFERPRNPELRAPYSRLPRNEAPRFPTSSGEPAQPLAYRLNMAMQALEAATKRLEQVAGALIGPPASAETRKTTSQRPASYALFSDVEDAILAAGHIVDDINGHCSRIAKGMSIDL